MLLYYSVATLHVFVCIILVLVVLLQSGKGADLAGAFGGGATQTAFGSRGPASFLSKMTTFAAVIFMLTSIGLSMISTPARSKSVLEGTAEGTTQTEKAKPKAEDETPVLSKEQIQRRVEELESKQKTPDATTPEPAPEPAGEQPKP
jgi:preprotein translocase subunit SecG